MYFIIGIASSSGLIMLCPMQCYQCGNPETMVKIKRDFISLKCKACGEVSDVDMRHKLNTFILKNPPEDKTSKAEKKCALLAHPGLLLYTAADAALTAVQD